MREMDKNIPWNNINDHLRSERKDLSPELRDWINESDENKVFFDEAVAIQKLTNEVPDSFSPDKAMAWSKIEERVSPSKSIGRFIPLITKVAAAVVLVVVGFSLSLLISPKDQNHLTRIHAPKGHKTQIFLPDSSIVFLNGGTILAYSDNFLSNRKVELSGEALFEVRKNTDSQFTVHTGYIDVDVFGTKFNVKAYNEDPEIEISLLEGNIGLSQNDRNLGNLVPGQIAVLNKETRKLGMQKGDVAKIISWASDELIFEDKSFEEIATYLERWYGVEIELDESLKKQHRFTFNIKTESLREMLNLINVITPIDYEIKGKKVKIMKKN
jgi:transmembrane sensor